MSLEVIPERRIVTCDCCQSKCDSSIKFLRRQNGRLIVHQEALDYQGMPCADGTVTFDLCDSCLRTINASINETMTAIRNGAK